MEFWFLSFDHKTQTGSADRLVFKEPSSTQQDGSAVRLPLKERGGISCGPPQRKCEVALFPEKEEDDLLRSAQVGVDRAYHLLWQEGYVRETLSAYFLRDNLPLSMSGSSGELIFAIATLVMVVRRSDRYPPVAATGSFNADGHYSGR